jgi:hypothetical protein
MTMTNPRYHNYGLAIVPWFSSDLPDAACSKVNSPILLLPSPSASYFSILVIEALPVACTCDTIQ